MTKLSYYRIIFDFSLPHHVSPERYFSVSTFNTFISILKQTFDGFFLLLTVKNHQKDIDVLRVWEKRIRLVGTFWKSGLDIKSKSTYVEVLINIYKLGSSIFGNYMKKSWVKTLLFFRIRFYAPKLLYLSTEWLPSNSNQDFTDGSIFHRFLPLYDDQDL